MHVPIFLADLTRLGGDVRSLAAAPHTDRSQGPEAPWAPSTTFSVALRR